MSIVIGISPESLLPKLKFMNVECNNHYGDGNCKLCSGDCDTDDDCTGDLVCFQIDGGEEVPGCSWGANSAATKNQNWDFCKLWQHPIIIFLLLYCIVNQPNKFSHI